MNPRSADPAVLVPASSRSGSVLPHHAASLTTFDWLDTIVDEMLVAHAQETAPATVSFAATTALETRLNGLDAALDGAAASMLRQVVLGCSPMIDARYAVVATRLTVVPLRPHARLDAAALLRVLASLWPPSAGAVSLNVASQGLLAELLRSRPSTNVMIEVPAFMAADPAHLDALLELASLGNALLLKGRPARELPREALRCFKWSIIDLADDRRVGEAAPQAGRTIPFVQSGVQTMAQLAASFQRGAVAVLGWPIHGPASAGALPRPKLQVVLDAIARIDRGEPVAAVEQALVRDPVLSFELLRHIASPAFGLRAQAGSLRHALRILGEAQLRRWMAGRLQATGDDDRLRPINFAALRRGLLMRELAVDAHDTGTRGELFMCGWFSLLDRIFDRPIGALLELFDAPERVRRALVEGRGPFFPLLELVRAIESELPQDIRAAADAVFIEPLEFNRALLRTLAMAARLD